jgi:integrase
MGKSLRDDFRDPDWPKGLYRRGTCYRFRRVHKGRQINKTLGDVSERVAVERASEMNLQLSAGIDVGKQLRQRSLTCDAFIGEFLQMKAPGWAKKSLARYRATYDNFRAFLGEKRRQLPLSAVDYALARDYITSRATAPAAGKGKHKASSSRREGARPKTLIFELEALRALFREALRRKLVDENPFQTVKIKRPTREEVASRHRILSDQEAAALLAAAREFDEKGGDNAKLSDIFEFMLKTGLREGELRALEWSDIDFDQRLIRIGPKQMRETRVTAIPVNARPLIRRLLKGRSAEEQAFTPQSAQEIRTAVFLRKTDDLLALKVGDIDVTAGTIRLSCERPWRPKASSGNVPMAGSVKEMLQRLEKTVRPRSNFVFAHRDGGPCRIDLLEKLKKVQAKAGIPGRLRIHDLRHSCAAGLRRRGVPLETIMGILRHADIRETLVYAPYLVDEGRKAIQLLDR